MRLLEAQPSKSMSYSKLSHTSWECKYHIVFIPKYRKKILYGQIKKDLKDIFHKLAYQKECKIEEGYLMKDHVHMMISIPPKYSVSKIVGFLKGKTAIFIAQKYGKRKRNFSGQNFWARGYFVSTVGRDEKIVREYIQNQEKNDKSLDQRTLFNYQ